METRAALLFWPCHKLHPFCPDPFHLWRHTFPSGETVGVGGTGLTTSALLSTPKHPLCSSFCSGLSPQRPDTPTHLLRGLEVDALSQSGLAVPKRKSPVLTLAGRKTCCCFFFCFVFFPQSFLFARPLRDHGCHDIISSGHFPWPVPPSLAALSVT